MMSNRPGLNAFACSALSGPDHQVTSADTIPAMAAAASSSQPALTASQRRLVTLCVHAYWLVPVSNSCASSGAPARMPSTAGTPSVMITRNPIAWLPRNSVLDDRLPQLRDAVHAPSAECHWEAACTPVTTTRAANAAISAAVIAAAARYCRQTTQLIAITRPCGGPRRR